MKHKQITKKNKEIKTRKQKKAKRKKRRKKEKNKRETEIEKVKKGEAKSGWETKGDTEKTCPCLVGKKQVLYWNQTKEKKKTTPKKQKMRV